MAMGPRQAELPVWRTNATGKKLYVMAELGDGEPRVFMVDTGASLSVLSAEVASELGLGLRPDLRTLVGLGGSVRFEQTQVPTLEIGPYSLQGVTFAVDVAGVPSHAGLVPLAGILGNNVWGQLAGIVFNRSAQAAGPRWADVWANLAAKSGPRGSGKA